MIRTYLAAVIAVAASTVSSVAWSMLLTIDPGTEPFHPPSQHQAGTGSYWYAECSINFWCAIGMQSGPDGGLIIGQTQSASGSHTGAPDGSETAGIDMPWEFFGNTGMHMTTEPITVIGITGNTMLLDFSGWSRDYGGVVSDLGGDASLGDTGIAEVTCSLDGCVEGSSYRLEYAYHVRLDDPTGWRGVAHYMILEGTITAVPLPAAVWLFASGLVGLFSLARLRAHTSC